MTLVNNEDEDWEFGQRSSPKRPEIRSGLTDETDRPEKRSDLSGIVSAPANVLYMHCCL